MSKTRKPFRREDYYYDPKVFRGSRSPSSLASNGGQRGLGRHTLVWLVGSIIALTVVGLVWSALLKRQPGVRAPSVTATVEDSVDSCEPMPASGSHVVLAPSVIGKTHLRRSGISVQNLHRFPVVLVFADPKRQSPYMAVAVASGATTEFSLPVGRYGLYVLAGAHWCNLVVGFKDGARVDVNGGAEIQPERWLRIQLRARGVQAGELSIVYR